MCLNLFKIKRDLIFLCVGQKLTSNLHRYIRLRNGTESLGHPLCRQSKVCVVICDHKNCVRSMWGDRSYVIYSPTIYPFRFSRNIEPYIPWPFTLLGRYSLSIYHYSIKEGGAGPDKRLQTVAFLSLALDFVLTLSKFWGATRRLSKYIPWPFTHWPEFAQSSDKIW